ncbi:hypothetical protein PINS_up021759 [Pythium insidiosum]|nr:hypothetical protein PINS_up005750 [Pythium insidiosum]GLE09845.1 hypothetical protein PINS_up021759 [Pythium insidiosum]
MLDSERAIASYDSVERGDAIVDAALKKWGRVDILINNAGIVRDSSFARMTKQQWDDVTRVHMEGTMTVTKACWEVMREQHYGRIVNVSSASGLYGNFGQANYSAAKLGIAGFTFTISKEGEKRNVLANVVAPLAASQMTDGIVERELFERLQPELVSPFVAYLCHESCDRTGNVYEVGAGWVSQVRWQRSQGVLFPPEEMTIENIAERIDSIESFTRGATAYPRSLQDSLAHVRSLVLDETQGKN